MEVTWKPSPLIVDRDGNLWVATQGKGLFRIHGNDVDHYGRTDGMSSDSVHLLFEDREGIVWAATSNGIDSFRDPRVKVPSRQRKGWGKMPRQAFWPAEMAQSGLQTTAHSTTLLKGPSHPFAQTVVFRAIKSPRCLRTAPETCGSEWMTGCTCSRMGVFAGSPNRTINRLDWLLDWPRMLMGMFGQSASAIHQHLCGSAISRFRKISPTRKFPVAAHLRRIQREEFGSQLQRRNLRFSAVGLWRNSRSLKSGPVNRRIMANADGSVLAASEDGLVMLRQGTVRRMTTENGLPCNSVISFIEDKEKRWWLYTECGVVELSDSELQSWWSNPKALVHARVYDQLDGAQPNAPYFNPAAYSQDGRVWFANGAVVQMVDPSRLSQKAPPAETYIESLTVDRKEFAAAANLKLPAKPRDVQIDYTSPTFLISRKVKFRYRLDPFDHDWHEAGTRRQAFYTDLPPGTYKFRVIAANSEGVWDDSPAQLDFSIAPAYYQTTWFYAPQCGHLFTLLWAAYQFRVRQLAYSSICAGRASQRTYTYRPRPARHTATEFSSTFAKASGGYL